MSWDAKAIARFNERFGKKEVSLQLIDFFKRHENLDEEMTRKLDSISLTNLTRLLNDPDVRETIGVDIDNGGLLINFPIREVLKPIRRIMKDLMEKKINVKSIYYKHDRINYLGEFKKTDLPDRSLPHEVAKAEPSVLPTSNYDNNFTQPNLSKTDEPESKSDYESIDLEDNGSNLHQHTSNYTNPSRQLNLSKQNTIKSSEIENDSNTKREDSQKKKSEFSKKPRSKKLSVNRKYLIPTGFTLKIDQNRINAIYRELRSLEVDKFPNSTAVLFRVFLESSLDYYIDGLSVTTSRKSKGRYSLSNKLQDVCDYMENNKILRKVDLKGPRTAASNSNDIVSIDTLNAYVHNHNFSPDPLSIKTAWDNMSKFIEKIWESV